MNTGFSVLGFIDRYESGQVEGMLELVEGFQELLNRGLLFKLQGHYHRVGVELLEAGLIRPVSGGFQGEARQ